MADLANYAFWHIWEAWQYPMWLGISMGLGSIVGNRFLYKNNWKYSMFVGIFMAIFVGGILLLLEYHRFMKIWEEVIINGNI